MEQQGFSLFNLILVNLLHKLQNYEVAITCFDQALSFKITPLRLERKADSLNGKVTILIVFELGKKSDAKLCYIDALSRSSNNKVYIQKQLSKL